MALGLTQKSALILVWFSSALGQQPGPKHVSLQETLNHNRKLRQRDAGSQHMPPANVGAAAFDFEETAHRPFQTIHDIAEKAAKQVNARLAVFTTAAQKGLTAWAALKRQPSDSSSDFWSAQASSRAAATEQGAVSSSTFVLGVVSPMGFGFGGFFVWLVLISLFAYWYDAGGKATVRSYVGLEEAAPLRVETKTGASFRYGLFGCFEKPTLLLFSCCCGSVQWADNMRIAGVFEFYIAMLVVFALTFFGCLTSTLTYIVAVSFYTCQRQKLRVALNLRSGDPMTIAEDFCAYFCCQVCALTQEAREVQSLQLADPRPLMIEKIREQPLETQDEKNSPKSSPPPSENLTPSIPPSSAKPPPQSFMSKWFGGCASTASVAACGANKGTSRGRSRERSSNTSNTFGS